jgi:hypothetical protein
MAMKTGGIRCKGVTCLEQEKTLGKNRVSDNGNGEIEGETQQGP